MVTITKLSNSGLTVADDTVNTKHTLKANICGVVVFDVKNDNQPVIRTVRIYNTYNGGIVALVNTNTLSSLSTAYDANMDNYANNLTTMLYS